MILLNLAHETLSNPDKRAAYDRELLLTAPPPPPAAAERKPSKGERFHPFTITLNRYRRPDAQRRPTGRPRNSEVEPPAEDARAAAASPQPSAPEASTPPTDNQTESPGETEAPLWRSLFGPKTILYLVVGIAVLPRSSRIDFCCEDDIENIDRRRLGPDLFFKMKYPDNSTSTPDEKQRIMDYIHRRDELRVYDDDKIHRWEKPLSFALLCSWAVYCSRRLHLHCEKVLIFGPEPKVSTHSLQLAILQSPHPPHRLRRFDRPLLSPHNRSLSKGFM